MNRVLLLLVAVTSFSPAAIAIPHRCLDAAVCAHEMAARLRQRGWIGVTPETDPEHHRALIVEIFDGSPAEKAGLRVGDFITGLDGMEYDGSNERALLEHLDALRPGQTVTFEVERAGKKLEVPVRLEPIPEPILYQWIGQHVLEEHPVEGDPCPPSP